MSASTQLKLLPTHITTSSQRLQSSPITLYISDYSFSVILNSTSSDRFSCNDCTYNCTNNCNRFKKYLQNNISDYISFCLTTSTTRLHLTSEAKSVSALCIYYMWNSQYAEFSLKRGYYYHFVLNVLMMYILYHFWYIDEW